jgi:hypothetical protein
MPNAGDVQYRMKCAVCGRPFLVGSMSSKVPEHPQKGQPMHPEVLYARCPGSGLGGIVAGTKTKSLGET